MFPLLTFGVSVPCRTLASPLWKLQLCVVCACVCRAFSLQRDVFRAAGRSGRRPVDGTVGTAEADNDRGPAVARR